VSIYSEFFDYFFNGAYQKLLSDLDTRFASFFKEGDSRTDFSLDSPIIEELVLYGFCLMEAGDIEKASKVYFKVKGIVGKKEITSVNSFDLDLAFLGLNLSLLGVSEISFFEIYNELLLFLSLSDENIDRSVKAKYRGLVFRLKGYYDLLTSDYEQSKKNFLGARELFGEIEWKLGIGIANYDLGVISLFLVDIEKARAYFNQSLTVFKESSFVYGHVVSLHGLGISLLLQNRLDVAEQNLKEALHIIEEKKNFLNNPISSLVKNSLSLLYLLKGDLKTSKEYFVFSFSKKEGSSEIIPSVNYTFMFPVNLFLMVLVLNEKESPLDNKLKAILYPFVSAKNDFLRATGYYLLGLFSILDNNLFDAEICFEEALSYLPSSLGLFYWVLLNDLGALKIVIGDYSSAREFLSKSLEYFLSNNFKMGLFSSFFNLGVLELFNNNPRKSLEYFIHCLSYVEDLGFYWLKPIILLYLGEVYENMGSLEKARSCYIQGVSIIENYDLDLTFERITLKGKIKLLELSLSESNAGRDKEYNEKSENEEKNSD